MRRLLALVLLMTLWGVAPQDGGATAGSSVTTELHFLESERLEVSGREDLARTRTIVVRIAGEAVREDRGDRVSFILRPHDGTLVRLDHELRIYQRYAVPVHVENVLEGGLARAAFESLVAGEELSRVAVADRRRDGDGSRLTLEGAVAGKRYAVEVWLTPRDDVPTVAYLELLRNVGALSPASRSWSARLADEGSFPARVRVRFGDAGYRRSRDRRLVAVERTYDDPASLAARFDIPEGYRRAPARCIADFRVGSDSACRTVFRID